MSSFGDVAELGFAERWLSVEELRPLVRQTLDDLLQQEGPGWDKAVEKWGEHRFWAEFPERLWSIGAAGLLRLAALLDTPGLFDPSARFYFSSGVGVDPQQRVEFEWLPPRLEWVFGKYIFGCPCWAAVNRFYDVDVNRFLSDVRLRQARKELLDLRDKLAAARTLVAELSPTLNPTSRTGYLRSLRDCIGDPPDEYTTRSKEEWKGLRAEEDLRFTEGLAEASSPLRRLRSLFADSSTRLFTRLTPPGAKPSVVRSLSEREERGAKEWVERHKPLPEVLHRFESAIQESVDSGMEREHAETYYALQSVKGALGAAMREGRKDFARSTYALCDALFATFRRQQQLRQRQKARAAAEGDSDVSVLPPPLYTNLEGKYGLQEGDARWRNLRVPDEAGFRGLLSETLVMANDRVDCFDEDGYRVFADGARSDGEFMAVNGPIVCFEAEEADLQGAHSPVIIKQITVEKPRLSLLARLSSASADRCSSSSRASSSEPPEPPLSHRETHSLRRQTSGAFPPNTLFRLKKVKPAGSWLAPDGDTRPNVDLLVVTASFKAPSVASTSARGGKMTDLPVSLQYASRKAFVEGLDDIITRPLLTLEQELTRDFAWTDYKGASYTLREEWEYVNGAAVPATDKTPGTRDEFNGGVTLQQFCDRINDRIAKRREELKTVDPDAPMPSEANAFLTREEVLAVRLYSGPAYQPVNRFLREIANLSGGFRRMLATHPAVTFTATVSHLCRAIRKLSAITLPEEANRPLYRGVRGELPGSFWVRGELDLICATDTAFMFTSRNRAALL